MTGSEVVLPRVRVVIADDSPDLRTILRRLFEHDGRFEVVAEADNGEAVIERALEQQPDVVLVDLSMPVLSGSDAIPEIREAAPSAKVVVLSGFGFHDLGDAADLHADAFIEKGAGIDEILRMVAEVVGRVD